MGNVRARDFLPWLWGSALALIAYAPMIANWDRSGADDWQQFHHWWEAGRVAILRFGEWPLFDPYHCGGVPLWGQPQSALNAPTWWITGLAFGTTAGHKLFVLLHHAIGFAGMYTLSRRVHRFSPPAASLCAIAWSFGGFFAWHGSIGHATFLAFHYLPWIVLCWRRAHDDLRWAAGTSLLLGLVLFEGGTYAFPFTALVLVFDAIARVLEDPRSAPRVLKSALATLALTLAIGAARLWPIWETMQRFPRPTPLEDGATLAEVVEALTARDPHPWIGHARPWSESSAFVGWGVAILVLYGVAIAFARRRTWHLAIGVALFGALAMGTLGGVWPRLHALPVFDSLQAPSRAGVLLTFYVVPLAGLALDRMIRAMSARAIAPETMRGLAALAWLVVCGVGMEVLTSFVRVSDRWHAPAVEANAEPRFHLAPPAEYFDTFASYPSRNLGTVACYDPVPWPISDALWEGDLPQVRVAPTDAGQARELSRTHRSVRVRASLERPARVVFNQNFDRDWRFSSGEAVADRGRLAVDLPRGEQIVEARYAPRDLPWSVLASAIGVALAIALGRSRRARQA